jgi:hypothetical protein
MAVNRSTLPIPTPQLRAERLRAKIVLWKKGVVFMIYE